MFKKRLKGLLAMLLAGSIATTALPLTASATISGVIDVVDGGTVYPNHITCTSGGYSFEGSSYDAISGDLGPNYLWAIYADKGGTESGYIITTAKGDELAEKLYGLRESSTEYENVEITNSHKVLVTTADPSVADTDVSDAADVSEFPYRISFSDFGFTPINNSLQEATLTVWYGAEFGNTVDRYSVEKGASYAISAGSTEKEIPMSTVENIYKPVSGGSTIPFGIGVTIIQLQNSYNTFEIPVYDGCGKATNQKISVTKTNTDSALKDLNGAALKGKYVLVYDETQYNNNSNYIINKDQLWSVIEDVATEKGTFDVSKAKLVRYVYYDAVGGYFTSVDLLNEVANNSGINYLNERKTSGSIWNMRCTVIDPTGHYLYPNKFVYGDSFDAEIKEFLNEYDCDTVSLSNKTELHITATDPSTQVNPYGGFKLTDKYITIDTDKQYPVKVSDLAAKLTAEISPTAGMKYNKDEWELWPCYTSTGCIMMDSKATVADPTADIGIPHYELALEQYHNDLLVYFKQVAIAPAVTVTEPVVGASPVTTATVPENDGYSVDSVKWFDGDTELTSAAKFEGGKQYTVTVTLSPDSGLEFTEDTSVTINGENAAKTLTDGILTAKITFDTPLNSITNADITIDKPTLNGTPAATATVGDNANFTAAVAWSPSVEKFEAGKKYTVTATLTPNAGYVFTNNTVFKINGETVTPDVNDDGTLTVSYTFAELKTWLDIENELDDILNVENPTITVPSDNPTIPQSVFEKIKNSGKTVTINYDNGYSWEIDGSTIDLSKVPAGGVDLSIVTVDPNDWATVVNKVTGHKYRMQIDIAQEGDFGFTAILTVNLTEGMRNAPAGTYYANLYQIIGNRLVWSGYSPITQNENGEWIAKLQFTHASEWLITIDNKINPSTGNSSSSGGSSYRPVTEAKAAKTAKSEGWSNITNEIKAAQTGSTIEITLNDDTTITEEALQAAIDNKVKLVIDVGLGRTWTIDGAKAVSGKYIDLTVSGASVDIPAEAYKNIPCSSSNQLIINSRMLNFTAQLSDSVGKNKAGQNAAIYLYNEETGRLLFQELSVVDEDGNITFDVYCGGRYFIALGSEVNAENYQCGDANGDGVVDIFDASAILQNDVFGSVIDKRCADTNCDGKVNVFDASLILKYVVEIVKALPVSAA